MNRVAVWTCAGLVALSGIVLLAKAGYIQAKASLAQYLIEDAWQASAPAGRSVKPWPWADTWPVARLRLPGERVDLLVLAGDSGHALAFGPGHSLASAPLGSGGLAVVGGHRDTHFAFLRDLLPGTPLELELPDGSVRRYRTAAGAIVDIRRTPLVRDDRADTLLLVTCYPFDALTTGGPLRYVVAARPEPRAA